MFTKFLCWAHVRGHVLWTCVSILKNLLLLFLYLLCICILVFQINIFQFNSIQSSPGGQNPGRGLGRSLCQLYTTMAVVKHFIPVLLQFVADVPPWTSLTASTPGIDDAVQQLAVRHSVSCRWRRYDGRWTTTVVELLRPSYRRHRQDSGDGVTDGRTITFASRAYGWNGRGGGAKGTINLSGVVPPAPLPGAATDAFQIWQGFDYAVGWRGVGFKKKME